MKPDPEVVVEALGHVLEQLEVVDLRRTAATRDPARNLQPEPVGLAETLDVLEAPDARVSFARRLEHYAIREDAKNAAGATERLEVLDRDLKCRLACLGKDREHHRPRNLRKQEYAELGRNLPFEQREFELAVLS